MLFNSKDLLQAISSNVKKLRKTREWSQQELADRSELSRRMVQMIEQGENNVSLAVVCRLAEAFDLPFQELVAAPKPNGRPISSVREHGLHLWHGATQGTEAIQLESFPGNPCTEVWEWTFAPGERYAPEPIPGGTKEIIYVVEGELTLEHGPQTRVMKAFDSITFPSDRDHILVNSGPGRLRLLWMFTIRRTKG
jgi:transcriptional regulator with XRE-family HTH domain